MNVIENIESRIRKFLDGLTDAQRFAFISALVFGIVAHGFAMFNRLSVHDNSHCLFDLGASYEVNRWGLGILYRLMVYTTKTFSLPVFNILLSLIFIGIAAMLIMDMFQVKTRLVAVIIGGMMVVFPMVTSLNSFLFTTWAYFLGLIFAVQAARTLTKDYSVKNLVLSIIWLALSLSLYQAFLGVVITLMLLMMFVNVLECKTTTIGQYAKEGALSIVSLVLGLGVWAVVAKIFRTIKHIQLDDYKGWTEPYDISKFPGKLIDAMKNFLTFRMEGINALRYLRMLTLLIFLLTVVLIVVLLIKSKNNMALKLSSVVGVILIPVAMMIIYVLSTSDLYVVSTLMIYAEIFVFIIPLLLIEHVEGLMNTMADKVAQCVAALLIFCTAVVTVGYVYLDNAAYYKAAIYQEQAVVYMTALIANIKSTEGFSDDMDIVFVGFNNVEDATINELANKEQMDGIQLEKYYNSLEEMINYGVNIQFMRDHLGVGNDKIIIDEENEYAKETEIKNMPVYPNEGGIAIVDGRVIVKMGEKYID
ncbi:glucosyltransferase domain-containing protein [Pseudobutyrivibrio sp.]|uniref:glucosyltransferase domain-containing protein n=1 Tax=Pseudobutyrivibrio sp. TaxID=2014367 RepID=UPI001B450C7A|nr:glucosyltransferase domain-containing protein [Pseudobutyrivibrio sp.]MBP3261379.1 glucosyltransferase domain-containing protein [Pseudobutyrivibrio sp.]